MATVKQVQTNFSSGEIDPQLRWRTDAAAYANGAARLRNVALLNGGGVMRRPGTKHLALLGGRTRLVAFDYGVGQSYVLAFSNQRLDIYDLDGVVLQTVFTHPIATNLRWQTAQLFEMTVTQTADVMLVCHPAWPPQLIRRTSATSFSVTDFAFDQAVDGKQVYQPYYKFADDSVTLSPSSLSGSATFTASAAVFAPGHVGTRLRWHGVEALVTAYLGPTQLTAQFLRLPEPRLDLDPFKSELGTRTIEVTHVAHGFATGAVVEFSGANGFAGIGAGDLNGARTITVLDDDRYSFTAGGTTNATVSEDGGGSNVMFSATAIASRNWEEQSFSPVNGWPAACAFHEGRLWFGGTPAQPDGLWSSAISRFFNFAVGEGLDDESIQISIGSEDVSSVRHLVSNRDLQIFTASGEFVVPRNSQNGITPASVRVTRQTPYGASSVPPRVFDGATLFVQAAGKAVREFIYTDGQAAYASTDVSLLASHLLNAPRDMAVLYGTPERGEQYAFIVNGDGTLAVFHSARAEQLAGWVPWSMSSGSIDAVCTVGNAVYVSVLRGDSYSLERFAATDALSLDAAETRTLPVGSTSNAFGPGLRFAGKSVAIIGDGAYLGTFMAPNGGYWQLPVAVNSITIGYDYAVEIRTLPAHVQLPSGALAGMPKRISRVILALDTSLAVSVAGNRLQLRGVTDDLSEEPARFTGVKEFFLLGYAREADVTVTQDEPLPLRLLGMTMEVAF